MLAAVRSGIRTFPSLVVRFERAARRFNVSSAVIWKRVIVLFLRYGFSPDEVAESDHADPNVSPNEDAGSIGKRRLIRHQRRFNPTQWESLVEDKAVFYTYCRGVGLPIPELYAVVDRKTGWIASGKVINTRSKWEHFFENDLPQEFIIKPADGTYGRGVNLYRRTDASFEDRSGRRFSAASLYEFLQTNPTYKRFVIQERIFNHPEIQRLTGTKSVQTARMPTWVTKGGRVEVYYASFKLILGNNLIDNSDSGRTGNISSAVDPNSGELTAIIASSPDCIGYQVLPTHPVTGIRIAGTELPHWSAARQLVERAAHLFLPLRTIGWDVALTATGPVLLEGNAWWDPFNHLRWSEHRKRERAQFMSRFTTDSL